MDTWEKKVLQQHWEMFEDHRYSEEKISKVTRKNGILEIMYKDGKWFHYNEQGEWW